MGVHPAAPSACSTYWPSPRQRPSDTRRRLVHLGHRQPLARPASRVWRADNGRETAQTLGRNGDLGAHLASGVGALGSSRAAGLVHGLLGWLIRSGEEWGRACGTHPQRQRNQVDGRGRATWLTARLPAGERQSGGGTAGGADVGQYLCSAAPRASPVASGETCRGPVVW